jgi:prepilin-type N-terminal cleavage/methylation domain-containing protein
MKTLTNKGFSLVEILLSITLLAILFAIIVTRANPRNIISITKDNEREADALSIYQALEQYTITNNAYPESVKSMSKNSLANICKSTATSCTSPNINLSNILVPVYLSKIPEYSTDSNNSGFYVIKDSNGKIGIGGVKQVNNTTFVKGLDDQIFTP